MHIIWVIIALAALAFVAASVPGYLHTAREGYYPGREIALSEGLQTILDAVSVLASLVTALICAGLAVLIFARRRHDPMAMFVSFYLLLYGVVMAGPLEMLEFLLPGTAATAVLVIQPLFLTTPTLLLLALFPTGTFVPRWSRWLIPLSILLSLTTVLQPLFGNDGGSTWFLILLIGQWVAAAGFAIFVQIYRYRHVSSIVQRQQTRWALFGFAVFLVMAVLMAVPFYTVQSLPPDAPLPWWTNLNSTIWWLSVSIIPIFLTISILRYRLWDIDLIIRRTVTYATITGLLALTYIGGVILLQTIFNRLTGSDSPLAIVASTLMIAALFNPLRTRVQDIVDRRFNRRSYDAAQTLERFGDVARDEVSLENLEAALLSVVNDTIQPAHASLWLNDPPRHRSNTNHMP